MKKFLMGLAAVMAIMFVSAGTANAQSGIGWGSPSTGAYGNYGGYRSHGNYVRYGSPGNYQRSYNPHRHGAGHYDYHPGSYQRHGRHYDYVPGHYDYHRPSHWHR